jgi:hypothetical protein
MSEYIVGLTYTFTVDVTVLEKDFATWGVSGDVKVELCYSWEHPPTSIYKVLDSKTIKSILSKTDEIYTAKVEPKTVSYTGKFEDTGEFHLFLKWGPEAWQEYTIGTVRVRPARLIVKINDEKGNPLSDVTIEAYPTVGWEAWWGALTGRTGADGTAIIELTHPRASPLFFIDKPLDVYAYKIGYDKYPSRTHIGTAPAPINVGGDTSISGVMKYTGAGIAPAPVTVTIIVRDAETRKPIMGANVQMDSWVGSTDIEGKCIFSNVPSGTYKLTVSRPGYEGWSGSVDVVLGVPIEINLHPTAPPPPPPPTPIKVYFEVYDATTNAPLEGAEITVGEMPPIKTDSSGKAEIQLPSSGKYAVKVVKPGYRAWMESIDLIDGGKVIVKLLPEVAPPAPPAPTPPPAKIPPVLTVDKPFIFEGEEVKFTVSPSDVDVDLYEVVRREGKIYAIGKVKTFRGETTLKPPLGEHYYAVVYDELWSNEVQVIVSAKPPPTPPTLTVDRSAVFEGETVKLTVTPSDVEVELYEVVGAERKFIQRFTGELTLKPEVGSHTYIVKYDELWSNPVVVVVSPKPVTPPPAPILSVDKPAITEGESIKLTVTPSNIEVELYEIVGAERRYIERFMGEATITPTVGTHVYIVKHDEAWSNFVIVYVSPKPPTPTPPTPTPAKPTAKPNWNVAVTVSVGGEPVGLGEAEVTLMEVTPWQIERHNYGPVLTDPNGVAFFTGVAGAYYVDGEKYSDMTYEVTAKLRVPKKGLPAGSILKAYLTIMDETYRVST